MKQEIKKKLYTSPDVEVIEIMNRQVMCTSSSTNSLEDMPENYLDITF